MELSHIPGPAGKRLALHVTADAERQLRAGHPWLFDGAIQRRRGEGRAGDLAVIFGRRRRFLAIGLYDPASPIRVRVLHHGRPTPIDDDWFRARLAEAIARRAALAADSGTTGYRLVHGENDGLPGLVVDRYDATLVLKLDTAAWLPHLPPVVAALATLVAPARQVLRFSRAAARPAAEQGFQDGQVIVGAPLTGPVHFLENNLRFAADVVHGQKTGFFFDQRENRARVEELAAGRATLNVFAYSGGFSLYAARGGATTVLSLDQSRPALAAAVANFALNQDAPGVAAARHETVDGDAFERLPLLAAEGRVFGLVIVDPPTFARRQADILRALNAYERLTHQALGLLAPDGVLMLSSCSARVPADDFYAAVHAAAAAAGRPLREIARTGHALDHPIGFPQGAYLKALFAAAPPRRRDG